MKKNRKGNSNLILISIIMIIMIVMGVLMALQGLYIGFTLKNELLKIETQKELINKITELESKILPISYNYKKDICNKAFELEIPLKDIQKEVDGCESIYSDRINIKNSVEANKIQNELKDDGDENLKEKDIEKIEKEHEYPLDSLIDKAEDKLK